MCRRRLAFYDKTVEEYASQQPHRLTVGDVLAQAAPGTMLEPIPSAQYVHSQLPIRYFWRCLHFKGLLGGGF